MTQELFIECDSETLISQIGMNNIFAISGGRVTVRETGITLPVSNGYSVTIDLHANDTYTVRRIFTRAGKVSIKGQVQGIYCDEIGEISYQASCFRNVEMKVA
jgi:hypothetical protein